MTKLMGILNVTPDSFSDKGIYFDVGAAIQRGKEIGAQGADILDIGGESTRPGAPLVSIAEELARVIPVIEALRPCLSIPISIDTSKPEVALAAIEAGASFINDVTGFRHPEMQEIAATSGLDICVMHMLGTPQNMQVKPDYPEGILVQLLKWFDQQVATLTKRGVKEKQIMLDPGIGFGKTVADNLEIIQNLPKLRALGFPLLIGVSRKSFMGKMIHKTSAELLPATIAVNTMLIMESVDMIRVHDVCEHRGVIDLLKMVQLKKMRKYP